MNNNETGQRRNMEHFFLKVIMKMPTGRWHTHTHTISKFTVFFSNFV